jgi:hypothetical protein
MMENKALGLYRGRPTVSSSLGGQWRRAFFPHLCEFPQVDFACLEDENRRIPYAAKISPSRWIEFNTCSCGSPGHWQRMMK